MEGATLRFLAATSVLLSIKLRLCSAESFGINLGNVLEAPLEGQWAPVAQEYYFDDYLAAGFDYVRVPVRWDLHMDTNPPYEINASWLARVHEVAGWGLARNMTVLINSHHDDWIDNATTFPQMLPRFQALWTQVSASFATAPLALLFEVYNEPHEITLSQLNEMYASIVPIIRGSGGNNAVRPVYLGGLSWMSGKAPHGCSTLSRKSTLALGSFAAYWMVDNPNAVVFPTLPDGSRDPALRLETHSYDPWPFCGAQPATQQTWGSPSDVAAVMSM